VSKRSGFIVSGHCRRLAAQAAGMVLVPVIYQDFQTEAEELAVLVADNQVTLKSEINGNLMGDILVELDQVDYPIELTALSASQVDAYVVGPTGPPKANKASKTTRCPKCGHEW